MSSNQEMSAAFFVKDAAYGPVILNLNPEGFSLLASDLVSRESWWWALIKSCKVTELLKTRVAIKQQNGQEKSVRFQSRADMRRFFALLRNLNATISSRFGE